MDLNEYRDEALVTAMHPCKLPDDSHPNMVGLLYCAAKLCGESGEVAEIIGKALRDDDGQFDDERKTRLMYELGDVFWYLVRICDLLDLDPSIVLRMNISKLARRREEGKIGGDGSDR